MQLDPGRALHHCPVKQWRRYQASAANYSDPALRCTTDNILLPLSASSFATIKRSSMIDSSGIKKLHLQIQRTQYCISLCLSNAWAIASNWTWHTANSPFFSVPISSPRISDCPMGVWWISPALLWTLPSLLPAYTSSSVKTTWLPRTWHLFPLFLAFYAPLFENANPRITLKRGRGRPLFYTNQLPSYPGKTQPLKGLAASANLGHWPSLSPDLARRYSVTAHLK